MSQEESEEEDIFGDHIHQQEGDDDDPPPLPPPLLSTDVRRPTNNDNLLGAASSGQRDEEEEEEEREEEEEERVKKVRKPLLTLKVERLFSDNGIPYLTREFPKLKFKGKGHEASDLRYLLKHYEHWANRVYPKYTFTDFIKRVETFGSKSSHFKSQFRNMRYRSAGIPIPGERGGEGEGGIEEEMEREEELDSSMDHGEEENEEVQATGNISTQLTNHSNPSQSVDNLNLSLSQEPNNTLLVPTTNTNNDSSISSSTTSRPVAVVTNNVPDLWDIQQEDDPYNDIGDLLDDDDI